MDRTRTPSLQPCDKRTESMTRKIVVVCGPPCSGKSTYVDQRREPGDLVVDYDQIAQSLGSPVSHGHHYKFHKPTDRVIKQHINDIVLGKNQRAWIIRSMPTLAEREALVAKVKATEVVVLDDTDEVLQSRALLRPNRYQAMRAIEDWRAAAAASDPGYERPMA